MKEKDKNRFGLYIIAINIILILFLLTEEKSDINYGIVAIVSSIVAILFNIKILVNTKKKIHNSISLIINVIIIIFLDYFVITKYNII